MLSIHHLSCFENTMAEASVVMANPRPWCSNDVEFANGRSSTASARSAVEMLSLVRDVVREGRGLLGTGEIHM